LAWSRIRARLRSRRPAVRPRLGLEVLERRDLLSGAAVVPLDYQAAPLATGSGTQGLTPSEVRHAYGFDQVAPGKSGALDGSGQTIAVIEAYSDPTISADVAAFSKNYNLPLFNTASGPTFKIVNQAGGSTLPPKSKDWLWETALDVEWAHAIAPGANILLVDANTNSLSDLLTAVDYARHQSGVVAVSMSWGTGEFNGENTLDSVFTTPAGHLGGSAGKGTPQLPGGVSFIAAAGDWGAATLYPAVSPNVLTVGGSVLYTDAAGNYTGEIGWGPGSGGYSSYESEPSFQTGVQSSGHRTSPDVAYDAAPSTGFSVYNSTPDANNLWGWVVMGGTSAGAPQWAALIALADQGRAQAGKGALGNPDTALYSSSLRSDFHDITYGSNGYKDGPGYDLNTGLGSPRANLLVGALVNVNTTATPAGSAAATGTVNTSTAFAVPNAEQVSTPNPLPLPNVTIPSSAPPTGALAAVQSDVLFRNLALGRSLMEESAMGLKPIPVLSLTTGVGGGGDSGNREVAMAVFEDPMWMDSGSDQDDPGAADPADAGDS
jgi:subtilase family serine protease